MPEVVRPNNIIKNSLALTSSEDMFYNAYFIKARLMVDVTNPEDKKAAIEWLTHLLAWVKRKPHHKW